MLPISVVFMINLYGFAGLALILAGWVYEAVLVLRKNKKPLPFGFAAMYCAGSIMLTVYSWLLNDLVFIVLNAAAVAMAAVNIFLGLGQEGKQKA